jgi:hypothetical protein
MEYGMARHLTVPGTPQQNGLVERMNRTLLDKVRCMLHESGLTKRFWAEALNTAAYLINRSPSSAIGMMAPMEKWTGVKVDYSHLRVFGSLAYAHVKQDKLEPIALKCVFLGYSHEVKGYRLWSIEREGVKVMLSRDVTFNEEIMYKDLLKGACTNMKEVYKEVSVEVEENGSKCDSEPITSDSDQSGGTSDGHAEGGTLNRESTSVPHSLAKNRTRQKNNSSSKV